MLFNVKNNNCEILKFKNFNFNIFDFQQKFLKSKLGRMFLKAVNKIIKILNTFVNFFHRLF